MTHRRNDLPRLPRLARQLYIHGVAREVDDGAVAADVEERVVVVHAERGEGEARREFLLDDRVFEEGDRVGVGEGFDGVLVDGRVGAFGGGEVDLGVWGEDVVGVGGFGEVPALVAVAVSIWE